MRFCTFARRQKTEKNLAVEATAYTGRRNGPSHRGLLYLSLGLLRRPRGPWPWEPWRVGRAAGRLGARGVRRGSGRQNENENARLYIVFKHKLFQACSAKL